MAVTKKFLKCKTILIWLGSTYICTTIVLCTLFFMKLPEVFRSYGKIKSKFEYERTFFQVSKQVNSDILTKSYFESLL